MYQGVDFTVEDSIIIITITIEVIALKVVVLINFSFVIKKCFLINFSWFGSIICFAINKFEVTTHFKNLRLHYRYSQFINC